MLARPRVLVCRAPGAAIPGLHRPFLDAADIRQVLENLLGVVLYAVRRACPDMAGAIPEAPRRQDLMVLGAGKLAVRAPGLAVSVLDRLDKAVIPVHLASVVCRLENLVANSAVLPGAAAAELYRQDAGLSAA